MQADAIRIFHQGQRFTNLYSGFFKEAWYIFVIRFLPPPLQHLSGPDLFLGGADWAVRRPGARGAPGFCSESLPTWIWYDWITKEVREGMKLIEIVFSIA